MEAIWNIIKQRLRGGSWKTVAEFKQAIVNEWDKITLQQIQSRIMEMPWRCSQIKHLNGARVKLEEW